MHRKGEGGADDRDPTGSGITCMNTGRLLDRNLYRKVVIMAGYGHLVPTYRYQMALRSFFSDQHNRLETDTVQYLRFCNFENS